MLYYLYFALLCVCHEGSLPFYCSHRAALGHSTRTRVMQLTCRVLGLQAFLDIRAVNGN